MAQTARNGFVVVSALLLLLVSLVGSAAAQEPYPPPPPPSESEGTEVDAQVDVDLECGTARGTLEIEGGGFAAGTVVNIEISGSATLAADTEEVDDAGQFATAIVVPDDFDGDDVDVQVSGVDANDDAVSFTEVVPLANRCEGAGDDDIIGGGGQLDGAPDSGDEGTGGGALAFTGVNLLILLAVALLLLTVGTWIVRRRRDTQPDEVG